MISTGSVAILLRRGNNKRTMENFTSPRYRDMMMRFLILPLFMIFAVTFPVVSHAQSAMSQDDDYVVFEPQLKDTSVVIADSPDIPPEPNIIETPFYNAPDAEFVEQRIDKLLQGITVDIPPEYDHYGYEIRRYMAHIGNPAIYDHPERLKEEILNVKKARVIVTYWQKELDKEIDGIQKIIDEKGVNFPAPALTAFKQNKATVRSFMVTLQGWVDANDRFLTKAYEQHNYYQNYYPEIIFVYNVPERIDFYNLFLVKQSRLEELRKYQPFSIMVY